MLGIAALVFLLAAVYLLAQLFCRCCLILVTYDPVRYNYNKLKKTVRKRVQSAYHTFCQFLSVDFEYTASDLETVMASKVKTDLEIVYNLQWKRKCNGDDKQSNIIGVYDIPQTTLNWATFKSYLLKNSGTTGDDVRVSYMSEDGEVPVKSQRDFLIALYTFRKMARNSEVITLWLDPITDIKKKKNVVDAQTDAMESNVQEQAAAAAAAATMVESGPPEWFKNYMEQFRKAFLDDVKKLMTNNDESGSGYCRSYSTVPTTMRHEWKSKHDSKRSRQCARAPERELVRGTKLQNKFELDKKIEKLERKSLKLKERSLGLAAIAAMRLMDIDKGRSNGNKGGRISIPLEDLELRFFDAKPVKSQFVMIPHMAGGEVYLQNWEVMNTGDITWDSDTTLRHAWGHESIVAISASVPVPALKPGEQGMVSVALGIPLHPGKYESYWHFYHKNRRFGRWLGCQIMVDPYPVPNNTTEDLLQTSSSFTTSSPLPNPFEDHFSLESPRASPKLLNTDSLTEDMKSLSISNGASTSGNLEEEKATADDTINNSSSDSDNQSVISLADSNTSSSTCSEEFVILSSAEKEEESVEEAKYEEIAQNEGEELRFEEIAASQAKEVLVGETVDEELKVEEVVQNEVEMGEQDAAAAAEATENDDNNNINERDMAQDFRYCVLKTEARKSGYAYMTIDGKKLSVPKCFLHDEYLATAEDAPDPTESPKPQSETKSQGAIPKTTEIPIRFNAASISEASTFSKSMAETVPTFSEDFCKLTQCSTAAAAATARVLHDSYCSAAGSNFSDAGSTTESCNKCFTPTCNLPQSSTAQHESLTISDCSTVESSNISSMKSTTDGSRMFVFPAAVPGFEVVSMAASTTTATTTVSMENSGSATRETGGGAAKTDTSYYPFTLPTTSPAYNVYNYAPTAVAPDVISNNNAPTNTSLFGDASHSPFVQSTRYYEPIIFGTVPTQPPVLEHAFLYSHFPPRTEVHQPITATAPIYLPQPIQPPRRAPFQQRPSTTVNGTLQPQRLSNFWRHNTFTAPKAEERAIPVQQQVQTNLMTGAINAACSAMNSAKSVFHMVTPSTKPDEPESWIDDIWVTTQPETIRDAALRRLTEMGFTDRYYNATLLNRYEDDLEKVVTELLSNK